MKFFRYIGPCEVDFLFSKQRLTWPCVMCFNYMKNSHGCTLFLTKEGIFVKRPNLYWRIPNANCWAYLEQSYRNPSTLREPVMLNQSCDLTQLLEIASLPALWQWEQGRPPITRRKIYLFSEELFRVTLKFEGL